jgi:hypothetical protein
LHRASRRVARQCTKQTSGRRFRCARWSRSSKPPSGAWCPSATCSPTSCAALTVPSQLHAAADYHLTCNIVVSLDPVITLLTHATSTTPVLSACRVFLSFAPQFVQAGRGAQRGSRWRTRWRDAESPPRCQQNRLHGIGAGRARDPDCCSELQPQARLCRELIARHLCL